LISYHNESEKFTQQFNSIDLEHARNAVLRMSRTMNDAGHAMYRYWKNCNKVDNNTSSKSNVTKS